MYAKKFKSLRVWKFGSLKVNNGQEKGPKFGQKTAMGQQSTFIVLWFWIHLNWSSAWNVQTVKKKLDETEHQPKIGFNGKRMDLKKEEMTQQLDSLPSNRFQARSRDREHVDRDCMARFRRTHLTFFTTSGSSWPKIFSVQRPAAASAASQPNGACGAQQQI